MLRTPSPPQLLSTPFTGTAAATCPITLSAVHELAHPVAFASDPAQPYELAPLWTWVLLSDRHPLSGETCFLSDIVALRLPWGVEAADEAEAMLERMRTMGWGGTEEP
jgi:hypothetical protein